MKRGNGLNEKYHRYCNSIQCTKFTIFMYMYCTTYVLHTVLHMYYILYYICICTNVHMYYILYYICICTKFTVSNTRGHSKADRVGSRFSRILAGRVGSRFCGILAGRVSTSDFKVFLLNISWYLNRYESSNTEFGLTDFLRYLVYDD